MRNVILIGLVSFFADLSSEMVYPLIPIYLTTVLGATPTILGIIEGIAESLASLLKVYSGYISDRYNKKKPIAFFGYATGFIYKLALILSTTWGGILIARIIDRFGKGVRTAPRDVMVSDCVLEMKDPKNGAGKIFGIHKMFDMAGSAVGILLAFILLTQLGKNGYKTVFWISMIPMVMALMMFFFIKEKKQHNNSAKREPFWTNMKKLDSKLKLYLFVAFLFTLGNSSNTFLLLRATNVGFSGTDMILLYLVYNTVASLFAIPFGKRSDVVGRKRVLVAGYVVFALVYLMFAFASSKWMILTAFVIYGLYTAMVSGVEKAFISEIAPRELRGTLLGLHSTLVGVALLPASIIAGILWDQVGSAAPFVYGASLSLLAAILLLVGLKSEHMEKI